ncbi:ankyrin repeat domain-containing protein [Candidatus Avelusimicrobium gallicola]|uniref:Uncharacterized protein n=1 Tax=Candidatus Avelusimicrobium gallicola TaxID=2562704 RepID=A0A1Y4DFG8_9BACT|nr:ankyrin repeat domain-containing protein [Elusimicrobium sp. An273]OUO56429.1 hypothetical protein B5F75_04335 [Elusimicrobium sp. An273]
MKKIGFVFVFALAALPLCAQTAQNTNDSYTGYEGLVLGERTPRSATDTIADQATQVPGDIYRGTLFGAEQKKYEGDTLGNRPRPTTKFVYDTSLVRAIKISDADRVRTLMYANVDVNEKNYAGITPLTIAAEKGNMEIIKMLVEDGNALVNEASSYGVTPLIAAAAAGNDEAVAYLVEQGANVSAKDDWGKTALIYAATLDNPKLVSSVIKLDKTAVNLPDNLGNTALIYAAQKGLLDNMKILLANGANANYRNPATGISAISAAAAEGNSAAIRMLVRTGKADVNISDLSGRTPIFYAVEQNQEDALRTLLSLGADVNAQDNNGVSVLMRASAKNRQDCVNILLRQKGINPNLKDFQDRTALIYSVYADELAPTQALLKAGADLNVRDSSQNTPLMSAIKAKNDRAALFFIQQGAELTAVNSSGENAFMLTEEYLPNSMTANVLKVKKAESYQDALQLQAQKLAEVRTLEQQLAQEEARVKELQEQQAAKAQQEAQAKEAALRAKLEAEYQEKAAQAMQNDPELIRLQQQLDAAKAQRQAAMQEEIDRKVEEQLNKTDAPAPSVLTENAPAK